MAPLLALMPPWLVLAALVGVMSSAACFVFVGTRATHLGWYVVLGALAGGLGQVVGQAFQAPAPLLIGELNVGASTVAACSVVLIARLGGL